MKQVTICLLIMLAGALSGCTHFDSSDEERWINTRLIDTLQGDAMEGAIVRQHTLFPYHFVPETAELNDLGQHDLKVLADFYRRYPNTPLSLRQGGAGKSLYDARRRTVVKYLKDSGVKVANLKLSNTHPGGDPMSSEEVYLRFLNSQPEPRTAATPAAQPQTFKMDSYANGK